MNKSIKGRFFSFYYLLITFSSIFSVLICKPTAYAFIAVQACDIAIKGATSIDGYNSFCTPYTPESRLSVTLNYENGLTLKGHSEVYGEFAKFEDCSSVVSYVQNYINSAITQNNNSSIPIQFLQNGILVLSNHDSLTLKGGTYYFTGVKVSGNASLNFSGPVLIAVDGNVTVSGNASINLNDNPQMLTFAVSGKFNLKGHAAVRGLILTDGRVEVKGDSVLWGCAQTLDFNMAGHATMHCDKKLLLADVRVYPKEATIYTEETFTFSATAYTLQNEEVECVDFTWDLTDPNVASVSSSGTVTALNPGTTEIRAWVEYFYGSAILHVLSPMCTQLWSTQITGASSIKISDLENDRKFEVIVGTGSQSSAGSIIGNLYILDAATGNVLFSYHINAQSIGGATNEPSIADINNDGIKDIITGFGTFCCTGGLLIIDGASKNEFLRKPLADRIYTTGIIDINGDGVPEIFSGGGAYAKWYLLTAEGTILWNLSFSGWAEASQAIGDINKDNISEIIITQGAWPPGRVLVINAQTGNIEYFHYLLNGSYAAPVLGDIDGDNYLEAVIYSSQNYFAGQAKSEIFVLDSNYSIQWRKVSAVSSKNFFGTPVIADLNNDGRLEIITGSFGGHLQVFTPFGNPFWEREDLTPARTNMKIVTADMNGDGIEDVIFPNDAIYVLDGLTGETICKAGEGSQFFKASVVDFNNDGAYEIIAVGGGKVTAFGKFYPTSNIPEWPQPGHDILNSHNVLIKNLW